MRPHLKRLALRPAVPTLVVGATISVALLGIGLDVSSVFALGLAATVGVATMVRPEYGLYLLVVERVTALGHFFEIPRVGPFELSIVLVGVLLFALLTRFTFRNTPIYFRFAENWLLIALSVLIVLSMLLGPHVSSDNVRAFRQLFIMPVILYVLIVNFIDSPRKLSRFLVALLLADLGLVLSGVMNYLGWLDLRNVGVDPLTTRTAGIIGNPNGMAFALIGLLPFVVSYILQTSSTWIRLGMLILVGGNIFVILNTLSRGGFLSLSAVLVFMMYQVGRDKRLVILLVTVCVVAFLLLPAGLFERFDEVQSLQGNSRYGLVIIGVNMTIDNPILGVGYGNFRRYFRRYDTIGRGGATAPHNLYTSIASQTGIPSLILYLLIIGAAWHRLERVRLQASRGGQRIVMLLAIAVQAGLANVVIFGLTGHLEYEYLVFVCLGLAAVVDRLFGPEKSPLTAYRGRNSERPNVLAGAVS